MKIIDTFTKQEVADIVEASSSYREVMRKLGYRGGSGDSLKYVRKKISEYGIDVSHFTTERNKEVLQDEIFVAGSSVSQKALRKHFKMLNAVEYKCSLCGLPPEWNGKPLSLTLDHIDGDNHNNVISNLRWVCPNCDRQLDTYGSKNTLRLISNKRFCMDCGAEIHPKSLRCRSCAMKHKNRNIAT